MASHHLRRTRSTLHADYDLLPLRAEADAFCVGPDGDAFRFEDLAHTVRYIRVLAVDQPRASLDHRHLRSEAPVHLCELQADITAADHHQMARHRIELQNAGVCQIWHITRAWEIRHRRPPTDVEKDAFTLNRLIAYDHPMRGLKPSMAF